MSTLDCRSPAAAIAAHGRATRGFSLVELTVAITVLTIGLGAAASAIVAAQSLNRTKHEMDLALEAAQSVLESIKGVPFAEGFARFNATSADDPPAGSSPGAAFAVRGLNVQAGDVDGAVGQVLFPGDGVALLESSNDATLGMPRDLDGDAVIDALDHSGDYELLPVRVRVDWTGESGNLSVELIGSLTDV